MQGTDEDDLSIDQSLLKDHFVGVPQSEHTQDNVTMFSNCRKLDVVRVRLPGPTGWAFLQAHPTSRVGGAQMNRTRTEIAKLH